MPLKSKAQSRRPAGDRSPVGGNKRRRKPSVSIDSRYARFRLRVGPSRLDRHGVFACEPIAAGRMVIEYTGRHLSRRTYLREFAPLFRYRAPKRIYVMALTADHFIDGAVGGSGAECINHSCDPNLSIRRIRGRICMFSRRRIAAGAELTFDYQLLREAPKVRCLCGSPLCRGTLNVS